MILLLLLAHTVASQPCNCPTSKLPNLSPLLSPNILPQPSPLLSPNILPQPSPQLWPKQSPSNNWNPQPLQPIQPILHSNPSKPPSPVLLQSPVQSPLNHRSPINNQPPILLSNPPPSISEQNNYSVLISLPTPTSFFSCGLIFNEFYSIFSVTPRCVYNPTKYYWLYFSDIANTFKYKNYFAYIQNMQTFSNNSQLACGTTLAFYQNSTLFLRNAVTC